jgi:hypothetical protein
LKNKNHEKNERVEVYHERLLKLTNSLQHKTTYSFLTIVFKFRLQPYLHVAIVSMKRVTLQQHKETTLVCEKGIYKVDVISNMSIPQSSNIILAQKPQTITEKTLMYYTHCHRTNHNVETIKSKERNTLFLQFLRLPFNKSKYKVL